jgi:hypothetical protein
VAPAWVLPESEGLAAAHSPVRSDESSCSLLEARFLVVRTEGSC